MPATVNVAILKPIHAKLTRLAKQEGRQIRTVTNNLLSDAIQKRELEQRDQSPSAAGNKQS